MREDLDDAVSMARYTILRGPIPWSPDEMDLNSR